MTKAYPTLRGSGCPAPPWRSYRGFADTPEGSAMLENVLEKRAILALLMNQLACYHLQAGTQRPKSKGRRNGFGRSSAVPVW